ncbi:hypothetical protein EYF80_003330 [Liparis tanakae]|uniref:Uncharacterized protein n=1 Tax=Liparis tanakae TaxID=230148 RepID=A0A4Z2J8Y0_9TELE|nr:hypothetical protein EYF80_003330 [Liparis tanakae]
MKVCTFQLKEERQVRIEHLIVDRQWCAGGGDRSQVSVNKSGGTPSMPSLIHARKCRAGIGLAERRAAFTLAAVKLPRDLLGLFVASLLMDGHI